MKESVLDRKPVRKGISRDRAGKNAVPAMNAGRGTLKQRRSRRKRSWSDAALMALPKDGYKRELLDGRIIMSPAGFKHGDICSNLIIELGTFVRVHDLGKICDGQTGFRLLRGAKRKTVLSPDVSFVVKDRLPAGDAEEKFFIGAPDLAIEVLSPSDSRGRIEKKVRRYFLNGARLAWVVSPKKRWVRVYDTDGAFRERDENEVLDGGDLLPGLSLPVRRIFE